MSTINLEGLIMNVQYEQQGDCLIPYSLFLIPYRTGAYYRETQSPKYDVVGTEIVNAEVIFNTIV